MMGAQTRLVVWDGQKWFPFGYVLKMELTGFTNHLAMGYWRGIKRPPKVWSLTPGEGETRLAQLRKWGGMGFECDITAT